MNKKRYINKISSIFSINLIFEYIKYDNFKLKFLIHSKKYQKRLKITIFDYLGAYLLKRKLYPVKYFSYVHSYYYNSYPIDVYTKNILKKTFEEDTKKYKINENIFNKYLNIFFEEKKEYGNNFLDVYSPLFDLLCKHHDNFSKLFIPVNIEIIEKENLKNDFINGFNKIRQSNIKNISLLYNFNKVEDIDFLKEITNNLKIEKLILVQNVSKKNCFDSFFKSLFDLNIINNATFLKICFNEDNLSGTSLEKINTLKNLKKLKLSKLHVSDILVLKLKNLKSLYLDDCQNISFIKDTFLNLEKLNVNNSFIKIPESLLKLPNVKKCILNSRFYVIEDYISIFDLKSMTNITRLTIGINEFLDLDCSLFKFLQFLNINFNYYDINHVHYFKTKRHTIGIKMIKQIHLLKALEEVHIPFIEIKENDLIDGNESITILEITIDKFIKNKTCLITNLLNKFPNITIFKIKVKVADVIIRNQLNNKIKEYSVNMDNGVPTTIIWN